MRYRCAVGLVVVLGGAASCSGAAFEGGEGGTGGQQSGTGGKGLGIGGGASGGAAAASGGKPGSTSGGQAATGGAFGLGGAASGGAQGLGGAGTGGGSSGGSRTTGGTGSAGHAECKTVADCMLADDCCRCASVPSGELTPSCLLACIQSACSAQQISTGDIACVTGRCVLSRSCDERAVSCDAPTPQCDSGAVPEVTGTCYSGRCLAVTECSDVTSCDICTQRGLRCVTQGGIPRNTFHCVETPAACQNISSCACMGVCQDPFQCADTNSETLMCVCPIC